MDFPTSQEVKNKLHRIAKPYLEDLFNSLTSRKIIFVRTEDNSVAINETGFTIPLTEIDTIANQINDLITVTHTIHAKIANDNRTLGNLINYIEFFNERNITQIPLSNTRVRSLLESFHSTGKDGISENWYNELKNEKIDFTRAINQILSKFTEDQFAAHGGSFDYLVNPNLREYFESDGVLLVKKDHSKLISIQIKFRTDTNDISNLILRSISNWQSYPAPYEFASRYLIIVLYVNQQAPSFDRLLAQFNKLIVDNYERLLNRIVLVPISLYKIEDLAVKLSSLLLTMEGFSVNFNYDDSPLNHGWTGHSSLQEGGYSIFSQLTHKSYGKILSIRFPMIDRNNYVDYKLQTARKWRFEKVTFVFQPIAEYKIYIEISIKNDSKRFWLQIADGDKPPMENSTNGTEFIVYKNFRTDGDWKIVSLEVLVHFQATFGQHNLIFQGIEGIRLRGKINVARITFE